MYRKLNRNAPHSEYSADNFYMYLLDWTDPQRVHFPSGLTSARVAVDAYDLHRQLGLI